MITRDRRLLEQLIKQWAQDHTADYTIADYTPTEKGMENTQGWFSWVVQEKQVNINLLELADRIEFFLENRKKRKHPDGLLCSKCKNFIEFAEANQSDGSFVCYSCRSNPYR